MILFVTIRSRGGSFAHTKIGESSGNANFCNDFLHLFSASFLRRTPDRARHRNAPKRHAESAAARRPRDGKDGALPAQQSAIAKGRTGSKATTNSHRPGSRHGVRKTGDAAKWRQQQLQHERSRKHNNAELQLKTPKDECKIKTCSTGISRPMMIRNGDFSSFAVQPRERFGRKYVYPRNAPLRFREAPGTAQTAETHK